MAAEVETMFFTGREKPWHGLGTMVENASDLKDMPKNGYRFINAVSDFATHSQPLRETKNYRETLFNKTIEGNPITDKAFKLIMAA